MTDQLISTALALVTTIVGGIFGYLLSEFAARRREARERAERATSVKLIVGMETERNAGALRTFWDQVKQHDYDPAKSSPERRARDVARAFVDTPLLPFSRNALESQLTALPYALPQDDIRRVFTLYDQLGKLMTLRAELTEALRDQQREMTMFQQSQSRPGQPGGLLYAPRTPFDSKAAQVWDEIERLVNGVLGAANPLA
jgi:hypothetical protein